MAKRIFSKLTLIPFFAIAGGSIVVAGVGSAVGKTYYGTQKDTTNGEQAKLSKTFSLDEFLAGDSNSVKWIDNSITPDIYTKYNDKYEKDYELISYNKDNNKFSVVGVGEGYIKFTSNLDPSITFTKSFVTSFNSESTPSLIKSFNSSMGSTGTYTRSGLDSIKYLKVNNTDQYDFADVAHFQNLTSIVINHNDLSMLEPTNFVLNEKTYVYVGSFYEDYMNTSNTIWKDYKNRIFVDMPGENEINLVVYKNNGVFKTDDNNESYQSFLVPVDQGFKKLSKNEIERHGYNFVNYTEYQNNTNVITEETSLSKNTKAVANFSVTNYDVHFHLQTNDGETVVTKTFTYDNEAKLFDLNDVPALNNREIVGWSMSEDECSLDFEPEQSIINLNEGLECDLYAIYRWNMYDIVFTNDVDLYVKQTGITSDYKTPDEIINKFVNVSLGTFIGWSANKDAESAEYPYEKPILFKSFYSNKYDELIPEFVLYPIYSDSPTDTCMIHFIANGVQLNYQFEVKRNTNFIIPEPSEFLKDTKYTEKEGYKLTGWKDISSVEETVYKYDFTKDPVEIEIDGINFGKMTYSFEAFYEVNTLTIDVPYYTSNTDQAARQYNSIIIEYSNELEFDDTFSNRYGCKSPYFVFDFNEITDINIAHQITDDKDIKFDSNEMIKLYQSIIQSGVSNQNFEKEVEVIKIKDLYVKTDMLYTITFDSGEGTFSNGSKTKTKTIFYNQVAYFNDVEDPTRSGYDFTGWSNNEVNIDDINGKVYDREEGLTFVAKYKETGGGHCVTGDTKVKLLNVGETEIKNVQLGDYIETYDFLTGTTKYAPIVFLERLTADKFTIINLTFDDNTLIKIEGGHVFFDTDLMQFKTINIFNYNEFVGHSFAKINSSNEIESHKLVSAVVDVECVEIYEVVTGNSLISFISNDYLSSCNFTEPLLSIFPVTNDFRYDIDAIAKEVEKYGLYEYSDLAYIGLSEALFDHLGAKYFKIIVSKGITTLEELDTLYKEHFYEDPSIFYI